MTKRQTILAETQTILEGILTVAGDRLIPHVEVHKIGSQTQDNLPYPHAFVFLRSQIRNAPEAIIGNNSVTWTAELVIEFWVDEHNDIEDVLGEIQKAMVANSKLSGVLCESSILMNITHYILDVEEGMVLNYECLFRHTRNDP